MIPSAVETPNFFLSHTFSSVVTLCTVPTLGSRCAISSNMPISLAIEALRQAESGPEYFCGLQFIFPRYCLFDHHNGLGGPIAPYYKGT